MHPEGYFVRNAEEFAVGVSQLPVATIGAVDLRGHHLHGEVDGLVGGHRTRQRLGLWRAHAVATGEDEVIVRSPGAGAAVGQAPGLGEDEARREHFVVLNGDVGDEFGGVDAIIALGRGFPFCCALFARLRQVLVVPAEVDVAGDVAGGHGDLCADGAFCAGFRHSPLAGNKNRGIVVVEGVDGDAVGAGFQVGEGVVAVVAGGGAVQAVGGACAFTQIDDDTGDARLVRLQDAVGLIDALFEGDAAVGGDEGFVALTPANGTKVVPDRAFDAAGVGVGRDGRGGGFTLTLAADHVVSL